MIPKADDAYLEIHKHVSR